jgi:hypothetical protein
MESLEFGGKFLGTKHSPSVLLLLLLQAINKKNSPRIARVLGRVDGPAAALQSPVVSLPGRDRAHLSAPQGRASESV